MGWNSARLQEKKILDGKQKSLHYPNRGKESAFDGAAFEEVRFYKIGAQNRALGFLN